MASKITPVTPEIATYLAKNFSTEDDFLRKLREESLAAGMPPIHISGEQGAFLQLLLMAIQARTVLEIGSLAGYSAITMARVLPEGAKLVCLEKNNDYCQFIRRKAIEAGLDGIIEVHNCDAKEFLPHYLPAHQFDMVFIDADKHGYLQYYQQVFPLVRKGGIICADNTLAWGDIAKENTEKELPSVYALQQYNSAIAADKKVHSSLIPLGDGMTISIKVFAE